MQPWYVYGKMLKMKKEKDKINKKMHFRRLPPATAGRTATGLGREMLKSDGIVRFDRSGNRLSPKLKYVKQRIKVGPDIRQCRMN